MTGQAWICATCGVQYAFSEQPPAACPICVDERQYVGLSGQRWTALEELRATRRNILQEEEPGVWSIRTEPGFAIGQRAYLVRTGSGNLLWDCITLLDEETVRQVRALGGIDAMAISHPHYYSGMAEWSAAFGGAPVWIHEADREWVARPEAAVRFWNGERQPLFGGVTLIRSGGHFAGYQVGHWAAGAAGRGVLFAGDQPQVCMDPQWLTFMSAIPTGFHSGRPRCGVLWRVSKTSGLTGCMARSDGT